MCSSLRVDECSIFTCSKSFIGEPEIELKVTHAFMEFCWENDSSNNDKKDNFEMKFE